MCECVRVTDRSLESLFGSLHLESVSIAGCVKVTNASVLALSRTCACLAYLNVRGLALLSDGGLVSLLERAPCLRSLYAGVGSRGSRYWALKADATEAAEQQPASPTASDVQSHLSHCPAKTTRSQSEAGTGFLSGNKSPTGTTSSSNCGTDDVGRQQQQQQGLSDISLVALAQHCPCLERLSLQGLCRVTDEGLCWLVSSPSTAAAAGDVPVAATAGAPRGRGESSPRSRLVYLDIRHCARVTARGLQRVRALAPVGCFVEHTLLELSVCREAEQVQQRSLSRDSGVSSVQRESDT